MLNIFESPWLLLGTAIVVLLIIWVLRCIFPAKKRWWHFMIPLAIATLAFGLDFFVKTDMEKIRIVIDKGIKAVEEENTNEIGKLLSKDYSDSFHPDKETIMVYCTALMSQPLIEKITKMSLEIEKKDTTAAAVIIVLVKFDKKSSFADEAIQALQFKAKLNLKKGPDKNWLFNRVEIITINNQTINWKDIK